MYFGTFTPLILLFFFTIDYDVIQRSRTIRTPLPRAPGLVETVEKG